MGDWCICSSRVVGAGWWCAWHVHSTRAAGARWWLGVARGHGDIQCHIWVWIAVGVCGHGYWVLWEWQWLWGQQVCVEMGADRGWACQSHVWCPCEGVRVEEVWVDIISDPNAGLTAILLVHILVAVVGAVF